MLVLPIIVPIYHHHHRHHHHHPNSHPFPSHALLLATPPHKSLTITDHVLTATPHHHSIIAIIVSIFTLSSSSSPKLQQHTPIKKTIILLTMSHPAPDHTEAKRESNDIDYQQQQQQQSQQQSQLESPNQIDFSTPTTAFPSSPTPPLSTTTIKQIGQSDLASLTKTTSAPTTMITDHFSTTESTQRESQLDLRLQSMYDELVHQKRDFDFEKRVVGFETIQKEALVEINKREFELGKREFELVKREFELQQRDAEIEAKKKGVEMLIEAKRNELKEREIQIKEGEASFNARLVGMQLALLLPGQPRWHHNQPQINSPSRNHHYLIQ